MPKHWRWIGSRWCETELHAQTPQAKDNNNPSNVLARAVRVTPITHTHTHTFRAFGPVPFSRSFPSFTYSTATHALIIPDWYEGRQQSQPLPVYFTSNFPSLFFLPYEKGKHNTVHSFVMARHGDERGAPTHTHVQMSINNFFWQLSSQSQERRLPFTHWGHFHWANLLFFLEWNKHKSVQQQKPATTIPLLFVRRLFLAVYFANGSQSKQEKKRTKLHLL